MALSKESIESFLTLLSSNAPVPGGGGASALAGALAVSLAHMVAALTVGKPKYASAEAEMRDVLVRANELMGRFLALMDEDAEAFAPLSKAYRMPKESEPEREARSRAMEAALYTAAEPPLRIMETCGPALELIAFCAEKGSQLAVSDAGVAASLCRAALEGASMNVFVNTRLMRDRTRAETLNARARALLEEYGAKAHSVQKAVCAALNAPEV